MLIKRWRAYASVNPTPSCHHSQQLSSALSFAFGITLKTFIHAFKYELFTLNLLIMHYVVCSNGGQWLVVECLTGDRRAAGSSLTNINALCP